MQIMRTNLFLSYLVRSLWLDGVLPMVMDKEVGGEEKAVQTLEGVLLNNISAHTS